MTTPTPPPTVRVTTVATATMVTVIPITDDGLITIASTTPARRWCVFPSMVKPHPRVPTETVADRLLTRDLGSQHGPLRLVALFDPRPGHPHREAVYTTLVWWPAGRPTHDTYQRPILPLATRDQADRHGLRYGRIGVLLPSPDLAAAARALPELTALPEPWAAVAGLVAPGDNPARRFR